MALKASETALILIGYQNDYFAADGILNGVIATNSEHNHTLSNTFNFIDNALELGIKVYNVPIFFSDDYSELDNPVGLLAQIKELGAFKESTAGGAVIDEILKYGDKIQEVRGKTGFNCFSKTELNQTFINEGIKNVAFAGVVTSVCIDSSARASFELGYNTIVLSDCIAGRSKMENEFYCDDIFPLYAHVKTSQQLVNSFNE